MSNTITLPQRPARKFLPENFKLENWDSLKSYYQNLSDRNISSMPELMSWLADRSEIDSLVSEDMGWRYIRMTCDTANKDFADAYSLFITDISPQLAPVSNELDKKLLESPFLAELDKGDYKIFIRGLRKSVEIYRDENIPLYTRIQTEEQEFNTLAGEMTITHNGNELTLQQAASLLKETDREMREHIWRSISSRRAEDKEKLDDLFSRLCVLRHQVAKNAGFDNFRDYMFAALGRFDYTPEDCFSFHEAIRTQILPLSNYLDKDRKEKLKLDPLRPWDMEVDPSGLQGLKPFNGGVELMDKAIENFYKIDPFLGECLDILKQMNHVDLESRKGKAPGGYNYPLAEIGVPFIFMNSADTLRDVITMVHEGGHAVHSLVTRDLEYSAFKDTPSEVAELASMSMELIAMEHWDVFIEDKEQLRRARRQTLEKVISVMPWIATIDAFQHWIYTNPGHTTEQRTEAWKKIHSAYSNPEIDYSGLENAFNTSWQKQMHLYQVPFYYIEYGMAQLGAIAMWKSYKEDPKATIKNYLAALKLGYTRSISEIYETAGIKFDFSSDYVSELSNFIKQELENC